MEKIAAFDKANLKVVREKIDEALAKVESELGIKLDISNITYNAGHFKTQLTGLAGNAVSDPMLEGIDARWVRELQRGYGEQALKREITAQGKKFIVLGRRSGSFIVRFAPGTPDAQKRPGLLRLAFKNGDDVERQVMGI